MGDFCFPFRPFLGAPSIDTPYNYPSTLYRLDRQSIAVAFSGILSLLFMTREHRPEMVNSLN